MERPIVVAEFRELFGLHVTGRLTLKNEGVFAVASPLVVVPQRTG